LSRAVFRTALSVISDDARLVMERLRERGPSFFPGLSRRPVVRPDRLRIALSALVAAGCAASDGFAGLRVLVAADQGKPWPLNAGRISRVAGT
jgi:hypothetical protein